MSKLRITSLIFGLGLIAVLNLIFKGYWILPQFFSIGPLIIRYYGLFMALAAAVGYLIAKKRAPNFNIPSQLSDDIIFWLIIGGFVGARLYHVLSSFYYYVDHPLYVLKVWQGGLSIYGAVLGGILTLWLCKKFFIFHFSFFTLLNWLTPSLVVGQIIARFGNLFNYELYGYPTNLPWKMFVPTVFRPAQFVTQNFFHPLFLYEQIFLAIILAALFGLERFRPKSPLFFYYLLWYNLVRFGLEFLRIDSVFWHQFRVNAFVSLALAGFAACWLLLNERRPSTSG